MGIEILFGEIMRFPTKIPAQPKEQKSLNIHADYQIHSGQHDLQSGNRRCLYSNYSQSSCFSTNTWVCDNNRWRCRSFDHFNRSLCIYQRLFCKTREMESTQKTYSPQTAFDTTTTKDIGFLPAMTGYNITSRLFNQVKIKFVQLLKNSTHFQYVPSNV